MANQKIDAVCCMPPDVCLPLLNGKTDRTILRLALSLSQLAYTMDTAAFLDAGWQDVSFQVDDLLLTGFKNRRGCDQASAKARSRLTKVDPISQYLGFKKQKEELDACKALVMAHALPDGRYCVAVAFTGTTRRLYDWLGNLQIEDNEGFHAGFLHLTKLFEKNAGRILFPQTGVQIGREKLTLADILSDMRAGNGRFSLLVTGHSQGAALTQLYVHRLMESGVPAAGVQGIGFASPCVAMRRDPALAAAYPVTNIINADDVVARLGGKMHIGMCRVLPVSEAYRRTCYGDAAGTMLMRDVLMLMHQVRCTQDALLLGMALTEKLTRLPEKISEEMLALLTRGLLPDMLTQRLAGYARHAAASVGRRLRAKYENVQGEVNEERLEVFREALEQLFFRHGAKESITVIGEMLMRPHALADSEQPRAYQTMVNEMERQLVSSLWIGSEDPVWDQLFEGDRRGRKVRCAYDRYHPLQTQRRRNCDGR